MKKRLMLIITLTMLFATACFDKKPLTDPPTTNKTTVTVSGSLGTMSGSLISKAVTGNVNGYAYIVAVPLSGENSIKAKITNNAFSLELNPELKYVFYFLNEYGIKVNELAFGTEGSAAKLENDISLGTIAADSSGTMAVAEDKVTAIKENIQTKEEVKTTGEFDSEKIKEELKETIKETLEETGKGTVTDDKIIIEATSSSDITNRIEITMNEDDSSSDDTIAFGKVEIVQEKDGQLSTMAIELSNDVSDSLDVVNAVVGKVEDTITDSSTTLDSIKEEIQTAVTAADNSITVQLPPPVVFIFSLVDQDKFRAYVEKLKVTYTGYYENYVTTIDKDILKLTRTNIKEHDNVTLGTIITEEITKDSETYQYKKNNVVVTSGSTVTSVLPATLVTLSPVTIFSTEAQSAFTTYVNELKTKYTEFYGSFTQEITAYKLTVTRTCLKAHDSIAKGTKITQEITKTDSDEYTLTTKVGNTTTTLIAATVSELIPNIPTLVAKYAFLNGEITTFNTFYTNMQTKYSGFYGLYSKIATEDELSITRTALKTHLYFDKNVAKGQQVIEKIKKLDVENYQYICTIGGTPSSPKYGKTLESVIPEWQTLEEIVGLWNLTSTDFSNANTSNITALYASMTTLKAKSNSTAMNYLFQAIIDTKPIESALRDDIADGLGANLPVGLTEDEIYEYADQVFDSPSKIYKVVTARGLTALDVISSNLQKAYETNETVTFDKVNLTNGYNVILTPAHFKAMSGAFKVYIAQLYLLSSYKFENDDDLNRFASFIKETSKTNTLDIDFIRKTFPTLEVLDVNTTYQTKALKYMQEGTAELLSAANTLPITSAMIALKSKVNVLSISTEDKTELLKYLTLADKLMTSGGTTVEITVDGITTNIKVDLTKLYTLDIKALVSELLDGTEGKYGTEAVKIIENNITDSTYRGIFPNKIPSALLK